MTWTKSADATVSDLSHTLTEHFLHTGFTRTLLKAAQATEGRHTSMCFYGGFV